jgi:FixJ family two-component response regulator
VRVYESAEAFLDADPIGDVACIISDVHMKGITGLEMRPFSSADRRLP